MSQNTITNTSELSNKIKNRRMELGLTIKAAASKAGVGTKTWCRYEAGESIRSDKVRGLCKALNWKTLPEGAYDNDEMFNLSYYKDNYAWSSFISDKYGEVAAISFVMGSEILLDCIKEDMNELSKMPKGTHLGQLDFSVLVDMLPEQFLMEYDYSFIYRLYTVVCRMRSAANYGFEIVAHSVIEELALYLMVEEANLLIESQRDEMVQSGIDVSVKWDEWIYDMFENMDIVTFLYSDWWLPEDHTYHFVHWFENQFFV